MIPDPTTIASFEFDNQDVTSITYTTTGVTPGSAIIDSVYTSAAAIGTYKVVTNFSGGTTYGTPQDYLITMSTLTVSSSLVQTGSTLTLNFRQLLHFLRQSHN